MSANNISLDQAVSAAVTEALKDLYGIDDAGKVTLTPTRKGFEGNITVVTFPYAKAAHAAPAAVGEALGHWLMANRPELVKGYNVVQGFLNLVIAPSYWATVLGRIVEAGEQWGLTEPTEQSPLVMVEYSSPNTNKPLHLGHLRNILLGHSLSEILRACGNRVVKTNIVNDRGVHICKSMIAWQRWMDGATPESLHVKGDHLIGDCYVAFDKHYKAELAQIRAEHPDWTDQQVEGASTLMRDAHAMLVQWEQGDPEVRALWQKMNQWVYAGFDATYQRMGVTFDKIYYESQTYLVGKDKVLEGLEKGLMERHDDGSVWADFTPQGLDKKLLLRSDGTSVYMTQDVGTAKLRYDDYPIDKMIYVVGNEQEYHFQVLALLLDRLGFKWGKDLVHFSYGMVKLPEGRMKSREGTVVDADDLMAEMVDTARQTAQEMEKNAGLTAAEIDEIAEIVGMGALKYFLLKVDPRKDMTFNPKESIDFNGNTGPFIQYTHARICSVLRRTAQLPRVDYAHVEPDDKESALIQRLASLPEVVRAAGEAYSPALIANWTYDLTKEYNQFYHDHQILHEPDEARRTLRLDLSRATAQAISQAMRLLGIRVPQRM